MVILVMSAVPKILKENIPRLLMNVVVCGTQHMVALLANNLALNKLSFGPLSFFWAAVN